MTTINFNNLDEELRRYINFKLSEELFILAYDFGEEWHEEDFEIYIKDDCGITRVALNSIESDVATTYIYSQVMGLFQVGSVDDFKESEEIDGYIKIVKYDSSKISYDDINILNNMVTF